MEFILLSKSGQPCIGHVEMYVNDERLGNRTAVSVYYMPDGFKEHINPRVAVTVFTEIGKDSLTDGTFHDIMNSIVDIVKKRAMIYLKNPDVLTYLDTVTLHIKNIDDVDEMTHGDYSMD